MAIAIVCTQSPEKFLARKKAGKTWDGKKQKGTFVTNKLALELRKAKKADKAPAQIAKRVMAVVTVTGPIKKQADPHGSRMFRWLADLAYAGEGALIVDGVVTYLSPVGAIRGQVEEMLAAGDFAGLATMIEDEEPAAEVGDDDDEDEDDEEEDEVANQTYAARQIVVPVVTQLARDNDLRCLPLLLALGADGYQQELQNHVIRLAALPAASGAKYRKLRTLAATIADERQAALDNRSTGPQSIEALRKIYEGVAANDASAKRLRARLGTWTWGDAYPLLIELAASGWDPPAKLQELAVADFKVTAIRDEAILTRVASEEFGRLGPLAARLQVIAEQHQSSYAAASSAATQEALATYERYRFEPEVVTPRSSSMDLALYRRLNNALYGEARDRPMLPQEIVLLVCDHRFDEAYATYVATFGQAHAEAAVRDAIAYFTNGAEFSAPPG